MRLIIGALILGSFLISLGFFLILHPLGYIAAGVLLIAPAIKGHKQ